MSRRKHKRDEFLMRLKDLSRERYVSKSELEKIGADSFEKTRKRLNKKLIRREQKKEYLVEGNSLTRNKLRR